MSDLNKYAAIAFSISLALWLTGCSANSFDGEKAFGFLTAQTSLGPRFPGSPGHEKAAGYIKDQIKPYCDSVITQSFPLDSHGKQIECQNIIGLINPAAKKWVLICAHWDTRPFADMEVDPIKKLRPIPGANDGASGAAVLIELARVFSKNKPGVGVALVFFDAEDWGTGSRDMFIGSRYFAKNLDKLTANDKPIKFEYGILLDMIGDKDLNIYREENSVQAAGKIVDRLWNTARDLGYEKQFISNIKYSIQDDHIPLIDAGVKCIDVIDFDYAPWHTLDDTPDKCSASSLQCVGDVVKTMVYNER